MTQNGTPLRASDPKGISVTREIPLWGLLSAVGGFVVQAVLMWNGQNMQAQEMRHQSEQITELTAQVKAISAQLTTKDGTDLEQNLRISDLSRRVQILETGKADK